VHTHRIHTMTMEAKRAYIAVMTQLDLALAKERAQRKYLERLSKAQTTAEFRAIATQGFKPWR